MDTNILAALVSAGVSVIITGIYWGWRHIYQYWTKQKVFKTYKNYAVECLEELIYYHKKNKIRYTVDPKDHIEYDLKDLEFNFVIKTGNEYGLIQKNTIMSIIISFMAEKYLLDEKEQTLLCKILARMTLKPWSIKAKYEDGETKRQIEFLSITIQNKNNSLSQILPSVYGITLPNVNIDFLEKILVQLKHNEFDKRIKKILRGAINNANINH